MFASFTSRILLSGLFLWAFFLAVYWTLAYTQHGQPISTPFVLWVSIPLIGISISLLALTWLPSHVEPTEWLMPILYPFLLFILVRLLFLPYHESLLRTPYGTPLAPPPESSVLFLACALALLLMALYGFLHLVRNEFRTVAMPLRILYTIAFTLVLWTGFDSLIQPYKPVYAIIDFETGTLIDAGKPRR